MDQATLRQYEHRAGCVLFEDAFCDGCDRKFEDKEMAFRCLECSGFVCPGGIRRPIRETEITTTTQIYDGPSVQLRSSASTLYSGYDLCLDCAKKPYIHSHHRFTLAICRKNNATRAPK